MIISTYDKQDDEVILDVSVYSTSFGNEHALIDVVLCGSMWYSGRRNRTPSTYEAGLNENDDAVADTIPRSFVNKSLDVWQRWDIVESG